MKTPSKLSHMSLQGCHLSFVGPKILNLNQATEEFFEHSFAKLSGLVWDGLMGSEKMKTGPGSKDT